MNTPNAESDGCCYYYIILLRFRLVFAGTEGDVIPTDDGQTRVQSTIGFVANSI